MHVHPKQEERFEVIAGKMEFRMGLKKIEAGPGDIVTVPKGKAHKFANAGDTTAVVRVTVTPRSRWSACSRPQSRLPTRAATPQAGCPSRSTWRSSSPLSRRGPRSG